MAIRQEDIRNIPLFAPLFSQPKPADDQLRRQILTEITSRKCREETTIFDEGSEGDHAFVVKSGRAKVVLYGENGRELIVEFKEPPAMFGELAILDGARRSATVVGLKGSEFYEIPRAIFEAAIRHNAAVAKELVAHLVRSLRRTTEQLRARCLDEPDRQVLHRLYLSSGRIEKKEDGRLVLSRCAPIHEIALMIGCSRENAGRTLADLEDAGYIRTRRTANRKLIEVTIEKKAVSVYFPEVARR
jgi:CRP-like cAMP-binding protein